ncbi:MAG: tRNA (N(6)-L-threonylcarbamoyladenosine(37)-C(2))-methylthiotransferase MtaB [Ruminococcaceae bacterium]|nr:tRNA (N(6)-L-threonylcarbamoyladenosine(37)-C(2))-methylthiotransferase MtaB [Oscillospiraceae bacterium]
MKVYFHTFGCKVNSFESAAMANILKEHGCAAANSEADAEIVVVNSCTVTANTDSKVRRYLAKVKRENPAVTTVLTGCMVEAARDKAALGALADIVMGNASRRDIFSVLDEYFSGGEKSIVSVKEQSREFEALFAPELEGHTRAFMKIEDGCERYCSYCIIPYARGRVRSMDIDEVTREAKTLAQNGYKEIVLSGINLSFYGKGTEYNLADAVERIAAVDGIERIRLGSLEPDLLEEMLPRLSRVEKLCPQFHLALQSGCDRTLRRMNRHYTAEGYRAVTEEIGALFKRPTFTTDVITGFPGETEEDFLESCEFVKSIGFLKVHVFPYSVRPGTAAASLPSQLTKAEKEARARTLIKQENESRKRVIAGFVGRSVRVILEQPNEDGLFCGYTDEYLPALVNAPQNKTGDMVTAEAKKLSGEALYIEQ